MALYALVVKRLKKQRSAEPILPFTVDVEYIEELITRVANPLTRQDLQEKYVELHYKAKKTPVAKALSYDIFRAFVQNFSEDIVEVDERVRKELAMPENPGFEAVPEERTQEEAD